ncbi:HK97 gp10 family phage protein [Ileibacterium valens]|uniref:HK97 gp10 family phage protein n=1 Tax=Ileibacterium valens TaxID=1862668 RepID=UPI0018E9E5D9|nr:HK97 gp10 family phage protein [Ileibacterium valens]
MVNIISIKQKGDFKKLERYLGKCKNLKLKNILSEYGDEGLEALKNSTPVDSGDTASSWSYDLKIGSDMSSITYKNSNINKGVNIAIILQYGHGTGTGGYVQGRDYINPAVQPIFDEIAETVWKEVTKV